MERALVRSSDLWATEPIEWADPARAQQGLRRAATDFERAALARRWRVLWCAGAGVVATSPADLAAERAALAALLDGLEPLARSRVAGSVFLASSAGGVYAGAAGSPFTEATPPRPLAAYGESKLEQEAAARLWATRAWA